MLNIDFQNKESLLNAFSTEQKCIDYLEALRWDGIVISPFDETSKVYYCRKNTYKCRNSGKYFNVKTATLFHNTKIDMQKWFVAIWLVSEQHKKINSVALSQELVITQKSAWYMIKRIKQYLQTNTNTFERKKNLPLATQIVVTSKVTGTEVVGGKDKLSLLQWLQLLKK